MRDELLALFSNTERLSPGGMVTPDGPVIAGGRFALAPTQQQESAPSHQSRTDDPASAISREPSVYLRRHLSRVAGRSGLGPSGLDSLDRALGGGFAPGLHLVLGPARCGKSAFILTLAWHAVSERRPVLLYSPRDGTQVVWERLIATTAIVLGERALSADTLRGAKTEDVDLKRLTLLDAALQDSVLPFLSLRGTLPADEDAPSAFVQQIRDHAQDTGERQSFPPLLLLDDLESLLVRAGTPPAGKVLARLDRALATESVAAVATATSSTPRTWDPRDLQVTTVMSLRPIRGALGNSFNDEHSKDSRQRETFADVAQVDVDILANATTGQMDAFPLLLDLASGLYVDVARTRALPSARAWSPSR